GRSAWIPDPGGDFGVALASLLKNDRGLGVLGGRIALAVMFLLTFVLYADLLYAGSAESALRWLDSGGLLAVLPWPNRRTAPARRPARRRTRGAAADDADEEDDDERPSSKAELDAALDDALGADEDDDEDESERPARRRSRRKASAKVEVEEEEEEEDEEKEPPPPPPRKTPIPLIVHAKKAPHAMPAKQALHHNA